MDGELKRIEVENKRLINEKPRRELEDPNKGLSAAAKAIAVISAGTRNMFFHRSAIQLATRALAMPEGGDDADDVMMVSTLARR